MEDLRQTALAYYMVANDETRHVVGEIFKEMDPNNHGYVRFKEFSVYMDTVGCENMSSVEFYNELKQSQYDELHLDDIITLFYIIHSKRPFCGGKCKKFVKGTYFTCVKCFDFDHDEGTTFSVCSQCFADMNYEHRHEGFLDPIVLLHFKRMEALSSKQQSTTSMDSEAASSSSTTSDHIRTITSSTSYRPKRDLDRPRSSASSSSYSHSTDKQGTTSDSISYHYAIVPVVVQYKQSKMQTAIQFGQLVARIASIAVASQLCTIM
ncbi:Parvalbumin [Trema orientale]|uniref:Parvalbumin n=1 Tax=Trema orientale TaxID=63057 RepID=A0A2P5FAQ7_TREOI|nr:Parvalbumin [Trema orientale]